MPLAASSKVRLHDPTFQDKQSLRALKAAVARAGGIRPFAAATQLPSTTVWRALNAQRTPLSPRIAQALRAFEEQPRPAKARRKRRAQPKTVAGDDLRALRLEKGLMVQDVASLTSLPSNKLFAWEQHTLQRDVFRTIKKRLKRMPPALFVLPAELTQARQAPA